MVLKQKTPIDLFLYLATRQAQPGIHLLGRNNSIPCSALPSGILKLSKHHEILLKFEKKHFFDVFCSFKIEK